MTEQYDAIVVGARATFPSDTVSTHLIHAPGVAALDRWGLLEDVKASGCPPIPAYSFDFGPPVLTGTPHGVDGVTAAYAPRRTVLDKILVDAAAAAGAEVREGFTVDEVIIEDGAVTGIRGREGQGRSVVERARVVIGADGRNSRVANAVRPEQYHEKPMLQWSYYTYWSGLPASGMETYIRPDRGWALIPTNDDDLTLLVVGWPYAEAPAYRADVEGNYLKTLELVPAVAERVRAATRVERFSGGSVANYFRRPYGRGWVLIGDAGYNKDPITAQGISDAFHDAERCVAALDAVFADRQSPSGAMSAYQQERDARAMPIFEFTTQMATLEPPPPEMHQLLAAVCGNQEATDAFVSVVAGTLSPVDFFDPARLGAVMATQGT